MDKLILWLGGILIGVGLTGLYFETFRQQDATCQEYITNNMHDTNQICKFMRQAGIKCEVEK